MLLTLAHSAFNWIDQSDTYVDRAFSRLGYGISMIPFVLVLLVDALVEGTLVLVPALLELFTTRICGCTKSTFLSRHLHNSFTVLALCLIITLSMPFYIICATPLKKHQEPSGGDN